MTTAVELHTAITGDGPAVVLVHGLLGNGRNLQTLAQSLASHYRVLTPDLRNHGRSPHSDVMDYPGLAADLIALLDQHAIEQATLVGHSLGGKAVMATTLLHPERVSKLAVLDMAPVPYADFFQGLIDQLKKLPVTDFSQRSEADAAMAEFISDSRMRAFLLQNLVREADGFAWRVNLPVLADQRRVMASFPDSQKPWPGQALFLHGADSDYVRPEHHASIHKLFPQATIEAVPNAGHWLHAEQPEAVAERLRAFLEI